MSIQGLEGPPEQGTDTPEAISRAIDKWAQRTAYWDKTEFGWPHWVADRPPWLADGPMGPTASSLLAGSSWLEDRGSRQLQLILTAEIPWLPPIYMRGGCKWRRTPHLTSILFFFFIWSLGAHPRCSRRPRSVGK